MTAHSRSGFTLVEVMIGVAILAVVTGTVLTLTRSTSDAYQSVALSVHNDARGYRALRKVKELLAEAGAQQIDPRPESPLFATSAEFQQGTGQVDGVSTWGPLQRIELAEDPLDPVNGLDDDGDGLIDERELVWLQDFGSAAERRRVLCRNVSGLMFGELPNGLDDNGNGLVDEPGACFTYTDESVTFRLTVAQPTEGGLVLRRAYGTTLWLMN